MPVLSHSLTLPQHLYPALDRLFSVFSSLFNSYAQSLWKEQGSSIFSGKGFTSSILKKHFSKPQDVPSRLYRNALETVGQIIRSRIERKTLFYALLSGQKVKSSPLFVENIKRQIERANCRGLSQLKRWNTNTSAQSVATCTLDSKIQRWFTT